MENTKLFEDDIEIIDDFEETEVLFDEPSSEAKVVPVVETPNTTYIKDNSFANNDKVWVGGLSEGEPTYHDAISIFDIEEKVKSMENTNVSAPRITEPVSHAPIINIEKPDLSDELDNTLMIAKQAINPDNKVEEKHHDKRKENTVGIILIILLFVILLAFALMLPYINDLIPSM